MNAWRVVVFGASLLACSSAPPPRTPLAGDFSGVWERTDEDGQKHGVVIFPDGDAFDVRLSDCRVGPIDARAHKVVVDERGAFLVIDGQKVAFLRLEGDTMTLMAWVGDTSRRATATRSTACKMPAAKPVVRASDDLPAPPPPPPK